MLLHLIAVITCGNMIFSRHYAVTKKTENEKINNKHTYFHGNFIRPL